MFEPDNIEEFGKNVSKAIEDLERENKRLHEEKANLLEIEAVLQAKSTKKLQCENKRTKNLG